MDARTANHALATVAQSTQVSISSRMADHKDLVPVSRTEFAAEMLPCLVLTALAGMAEDDKRAWLNAAYKALDGIPIALLKRGCAAALRRADHPSKIIPIITSEIGEDWAWRKKASDPNWLKLDAPAADAKDICAPEEASAILKRFNLDTPSSGMTDAPRRDPNRPCRAPTREDYLRMGIPAESLGECGL